MERSPYVAMTVNERLVVAGLLEEFERAAVARDRDRMIHILERVDLAAADECADAILGNPGFYGF